MIKFTIEFFILCSVINFSVFQLDGSTPVTPQSKEEIDTRFYLHTTEHPNVDINYRVSAYDLTSLRNSSFNPKRNTTFIVHGYYHNGNRQWLKDMAAGLLNFYKNCNVIRVDWGRGSFPSRDLAFANTRVVGEEVAFFINTLIREFNLNPTQVHCIGHSLGSYVCGFCGQGVGNLGWITALDISERGNLTNDQKLDPSDAMLVDCIHTDIKPTGFIPNLGNPNPHGHIDIYVNGGYDQPGCEFSLLDILILDLDYLLDPFVNEIYCSHFRAIHYYNESIWNPPCEWKAYECPNYETFLQTDQCNSCGDDNTKCAFLGLRAIEYPDKSREYVKFFIETEDQPPYCPQP